MPIVIYSKSRYKGTVTPEDLNVETTVVEISSQPDEYLVEGYIDLSAMQNGDIVVIKEYLRVGNGNPKTFVKITRVGEQEEPILRFYTKTLDRDSPYKVTITQTSGTPRSFSYVFFVENLMTV